MNTNQMLKIEKYLKFSIIGIGLVYLFSYLIIALIRMSYPFELEWMEGGSVEHIIRILQGKDIYVKPSMDFIPYIYTPLYSWVSALVSKIMGVGLMPLRLVSMVSSVICMIFIYLIVKKETDNKFAALVSMCLFPACFFIGGSWFDLARVDSLFLAMVLVSAYILRFKKTGGWFIIGGVFAFLAFFTKQSSMLIYAMIGIFLLFENWKRSLYFIFTFSILAIGSTIVYNYYSDGWYYFWNFSLVASHRWNKQFFILFWSNDLFKPISIAIAFSSVFILLKIVKKEIKPNLFYFGWLLGMIGCAWSSRLHYGGYDNVLIPAFTILIILMGIGLNEIMKLIGNDDDNKSMIMRIFVLMIVLGQFTTLYYNPRKLIPHGYDYENGWKFMNRVSKVDGDVYIATNSYISRIAGKKSFTHMMLVFDLMESNQKYGKMIRAEFENSLQSGKYKELYVNDWVLVNYPNIEKYYERKGKLFEHESAFSALTGFITRPEYVYVPRKISQ